MSRCCHWVSWLTSFIRLVCNAVLVLPRRDEEGASPFFNTGVASVLCYVALGRFESEAGYAHGSAGRLGRTPRRRPPMVHYKRLLGGSSWHRPLLSRFSPGSTPRTLRCVVNLFVAFVACLTLLRQVASDASMQCAKAWRVLLYAGCGRASRGVYGGGRRCCLKKGRRQFARASRAGELRARSVMAERQNARRVLLYTGCARS